MKILIAGAGIADPTLAYCLARFGVEPTIVEKAPALRTGGYIIDFWGAAFDVVDRMGLIHRIKVQQIRVVNHSGKKAAGSAAYRCRWSGFESAGDRLRPTTPF